MNCVRCGDPKQAHVGADGRNMRNAACKAFLERWEETPAPAPVKPAEPAPVVKP